MVHGSIRIGLLTPGAGPAGIWTPSAQASAVLAVAEINETGGLLGRQVELILGNGGSTAREAASAALDLVELDEVQAIVALLPSFARWPVSKAIDSRIPFVYTPQFEGFESDPSVVTVGETSEELLRPGIAWLGEHKNASRYYLLGNDYIWPRSTLATARRLIRGMGGAVVGERILPFGFSDYEPLLEEIRRSGADVVMPYLLGYEALGFDRAFVEAGLDHHVLRFTSAIDETVLCALGPDCTQNLYVTSAYFSSLRSRNNDAFLERYHGSFGTCPPPTNGFGQSCYEGIHCLAGLASASGALDPNDIQRRVGRAMQERTARGYDSTAVAGAPKPVHLATVDGIEFRVIERIT
ncbi:substrate-binding domain-containing protein [Stappia sp. F7233]|uniref:Substrate-binding domain-containing protein n=1 Tax=Stappia albiluteola TaxID=2758565 RepID=A0A839AHJ6_9HYPH|nr:substrate-binding domain-containing protein [Stappia albiluteola]MBA5778508.1 substrate-binding domain-containing protein [Stappia albiluteola]